MSRILSQAGLRAAKRFRAEVIGLSDLSTDRLAEIIDHETNHVALANALRAMVERYTSLVNCGDCGDWNPETDAEVIETRRELAKAEAVV